MNPALPSTIHFGREVCGDLLQAERREWWLSNGLGAYAAGNLAGTLTRRYHGLLVAPIQRPLGRMLVFAKADATMIDGGREWPLFSNRWRYGVVNPKGHLHVESFCLQGRMPVWRFAFGGIRLEYRIWMEPGAHTTYLAYRLLPGASEIGRRLRLRIKLLINARDHHGNAYPGAFDPIIESRNGRLQVKQSGEFTLHLHACGGNIEPDHTWMDVKVGEWAVTPRIGKPVEINALWYNALRTMALFAQRLRQTGRQSPHRFSALCQSRQRRPVRCPGRAGRA